MFGVTVPARRCISCDSRAPYVEVPLVLGDIVLSLAMDAPHLAQVFDSFHEAQNTVNRYGLASIQLFINFGNSGYLATHHPLYNAFKYRFIGMKNYLDYSAAV